MNNYGCLYVVGTPIGNLSDMSERVKETLSQADFIAAEDTRNSLKLLNHIGIKKPLVSYYEHNRRERGQMIIDRIMGGETCALVSDAGMPAISDPGEDLVDLCHKNGISVIVIPGPCAAVCALAGLGLPSGRFCFEGFLSTSKKSREEHLFSLKSEKRTMIFYEAPHKLLKTLHDMLNTFGDRELGIGRELTKKFEELERTTLSSAYEKYQTQTPKGEFVLVVDGCKKECSLDKMSNEEALNLMQRFIKDGMKPKIAAGEAANISGLSKNYLYQLYLHNKHS